MTDGRTKTNEPKCKDCKYCKRCDRYSIRCYHPQDKEPSPRMGNSRLACNRYEER